MNNITHQHTVAQIQRFAELTIKLVIHGNIQRAKRCLQTADDLFSKSNEEIKNAIVRVYVFSVSGFIKMHRCSIKNLFPQLLQNEYNKHVNNTALCLP